jgi:tRNA U34 5-methylaminomethyl-2-thiouridine-forming methyltransferase MnmC
MPKNQHADIEWRDGGLPVSVRFNDPYFSMHDGLAETRYVYLGGNGLPARFVPGFHIAELGFGTGLGLMVAVLAWRQSGQGGPLRFTSFEAFPMRAADMAKALAVFPEVSEVARPILEALSTGVTRIETSDVIAQIVLGDARETVAMWPQKADAWFLDGFAPAQNPELWEEPLMQAVATHTMPNGTFATYTAAGAVRRTLQSAGFEVTRQPGFGRKRHMSTGVLA